MNPIDKKQKTSLLNRSLDRVERIGNRLPHPLTLFAALALAMVLISGLCGVLGISATTALTDPASGETAVRTYDAISLMTRDGLTYILTQAVNNFTGFAPLGVVLVCMLGVGCAENSGYISAVLVKAAEKTPKRLLAPTIVFLGVMSNIATDVGYVVLIPLGAMLFSAFKRHPIAGLAAAFAGVSGGFSANLIIGAVDPLIGSITTEAASIIDPGYVVNPTDNYYFMAVSTVLIVFLGTLITEKIVEPRLGSWTPADRQEMTRLDNREQKALKWANSSAFVYLAAIALLCFPAGSFLRNPETGSLIEGSPLVNGIIPLIALLFFIPGAIYGRVSGKYKGEKDIAAQFGDSMNTMGSYIALSFFAAQFINYFAYTNLGTIQAVGGANLLEKSNVPGPVLMVLLVLFVAFINLFMGSASAKWTLLAPIFVPMFMLLGYSPELTQIAYRIGDSVTNLITPLMNYFAMIVVYVKKYDRNAGIGTLISTMLPYSLAFLIGWTILFLVWMLAGLPIGPGANMYY